MWLIDTSNFSLREVYDAVHDYPYGILSHTWDEPGDSALDSEVTFQDMQDLSRAQTKSGWRKIQKTCELARASALGWVWIDTCCIDKTNSAELTEAINSMFRWYRESKVCFAYLNDLPRTKDVSLRNLSRCRWFSRGWTLQELIAPVHVEFYDSAWEQCGTKATLESVICVITGIDAIVLRDSEALPEVPVARRMSWASRRSTKRTEDIAYSLFGIFDVSMPLIYGEGHKAFLRLQNEIIRQTGDFTLFAWRSTTDSVSRSPSVGQVYHGIFARSPADFTDSDGIVPIPDPVFTSTCHVKDADGVLQIYTLFNTTYIEKDYDNLDTEGEHMVHLCCQDTKASSDDDYIVAIRLVKTDEGFARVRPERLYYVLHQWFSWTYTGLKTFSVPKWITPRSAKNIRKRYDHAFRFIYNRSSRLNITCDAVLFNTQDNPNRVETQNSAPQSWDHSTATFLTGGSPKFTGLLTSKSTSGEFERQYPQGWRIICGFQSLPARDDPGSRSDPSPWVSLIVDKDDRQVRLLPIDSDHSHLQFTQLETQLKQFVSYSAAASYVGTHLQRELRTGNGCCTTALLFPRRQQNGRDACSSELLLSLTIQSLGENGPHEVTIRLESQKNIICSNPTPSTTTHNPTDDTDLFSITFAQPNIG